MSHETETPAENFADMSRHPQARLPVLLLRAMGSGEPQVSCKSPTEAAKHLQPLANRSGKWPSWSSQAGDP